MDTVVVQLKLIKRSADITQFSVVVPTLDEADSIDPLLTRLFALDLPANSFEVIFVDGGSRDGTPGRARAWAEHANIRLVEYRGTTPGT